jgi:hypothetical protein
VWEALNKLPRPAQPRNSVATVIFNFQYLPAVPSKAEALTGVVVRRVALLACFESGCVPMSGGPVVSLSGKLGRARACNSEPFYKVPLDGHN